MNKCKMEATYHHIKYNKAILTQDILCHLISITFIAGNEKKTKYQLYSHELTNLQNIYFLKNNKNRCIINTTINNSNDHNKESEQQKIYISEKIVYNLRKSSIF